MTNLPDSQALPMTINRKRRRKQRKVADMTQEELDALEFEAIKAEFNWSNDEWAATWLPWVRIAAIHVGGDPEKLKALMHDFVMAGEAPNYLEGLARARLHLVSLAELVSCALARSHLVLTRMGYSPDNLRDTRAH